ncbi:MAG TPA: hypothetical protein VKR52_15760 [Terracidiphilus sp.]|nr:hypothetical protein [Terracidiphilus sp.]
MAILVIGGSGRNVGKTTLICALIRQLTEVRWTAVKVSAHAHCPEIIWEEDSPGQGSDTARYLAAGAQRAFLVSAPDNEIPIREIRLAFDGVDNVIFESNRIVDCIRPSIAMAVWGPGTDIKPSFQAFLRKADAIVLVEDQKLVCALPRGLPVFRVKDFDCIPPDMMAWLRERLNTADR